MQRGTVAAASVAVALFFMTQSGPARAADAYDINVILPLTGGGAFLGKGEQQSLQLVEKAINATGGLQGRPLHYIFHDDETNPQTGVQLAGQVLAAKPAVVLGSSLLAICRAIAPLMEDVAVNYCFSPGIHPQPGSYTFTSSVSTLDLANAQVRYFRMKGWTRMALMVSTDATGQDAEEGFKSILAQPENKDMQLVQVAHFNTSDVSVSAQIANVKAANPQCFVAWSTGSPIATIFRAMLQAGLDVPFATTDGNMTYAQMGQYADFLPKQLYIPAAQWVVTAQAQLSPAAAKAHAEFYKYFDAAGAKPDEPSELAWDAAMIVNHALRTLGTTATAAQLHDFIEHLQGYAGIDGIYDFTKVPQRGLDVSAAVVTRWSDTAKTWQVVSKAAGVPLE
jgi:branched-chain amino acid transport system substrate-binding protein